MAEKTGRVELIFKELQEKELISKKRKIQSSKYVKNFKAGLVFSNTISYNPKLSNMNDDNIRFALLHEEGHKVKHQYGTPGVIFFFIMAVIPVIFNFLLSGNNLILSISILVYSLMFILISIKIFSEPLRGDEFESDLFAATVLRDSYDIKKPSEILHNTLTEIRLIFKHSGNISIPEKIIFGLFAYHPLDEDRIRNIRILVDHN